MRGFLKREFTFQYLIRTSLEIFFLKPDAHTPIVIAVALELEVTEACDYLYFTVYSTRKLCKPIKVAFQARFSMTRSEAFLEKYKSNLQWKNLRYAIK